MLPPEPWHSCTHYLVRDGVLLTLLNGRPLGAGGLWPSPGGARASLAWLRRQLERCGLTLTRGDIVLTGTVLDLRPVEPGDRVVVSLDGAPAVECRFGATRP